MAGFEEESFRRSIESSRVQRDTVYVLCISLLVSSSLLLYDTLCSSGTVDFLFFIKNVYIKLF